MKVADEADKGTDTVSIISEYPCSESLFYFLQFLQYSDRIRMCLGPFDDKEYTPNDCNYKFPRIVSLSVSLHN